MAYWKNTIAIVYDFDGTLTPQPMQEYTVLPEIGVDAQEFWSGVKEENNKTKGDVITTYMRLMLEKSNEKKFPITRKVLGDLARKIKYFPGVSSFFNRINKYVKEQHVSC